MSPRKEERWYRPLLKWLEQFGYYIGGESYDHRGNKNWYIRINPTRRCQLDVVGVKNIGTQDKPLSDEIELIGIEVKDVASLKYMHFAQAAGYKIFTHKVYLATTADLTPEDHHWARTLGIGLIAIKRVNQIYIKLEPKFNEPPRGEMLRLLKRMSIGLCTMCNCYFHLWEKFGDEPFHTYVSVPRVRQIDLIGTKSDEDWQEIIENPDTVEKEFKIRRYICRTCAKLLHLDVKGQLPELE